MNVSLTEKQEKYIDERVKSGDFQNRSEVVRDALRQHEMAREKTIRDILKLIETAWDGPASKFSIKEMIEQEKTKRKNPSVFSIKNESGNSK